MFLAIVPAYNEEERIGAVVTDLRQVVDGVIVVDDGSEDGTAHAAKNAGATVISHALNRGQGASLATGQAYARDLGPDFVLHFDGDGQFDIRDIGPAHQALLNAKADILFGSRFLDDRSRVPFLKRHILLPIARFIGKWYSGLPLRDAHNGFRLLNRRALESVSLTHDRMAHASEIPALVRRHKLHYIEFPVRVVYREYGQNFRGGLSILRDLFLGKFVSK